MDEQSRDSVGTSHSDRVRESRVAGPGLLDRLPGMVYQSRNDPFWTMEFVSAGAFDLTGYEPTELVSARPDNANPTYVELIHADDRRRVWHTIQEAVEEDRPFELEYRIRTRSGRLKWVWERGYPVRDADGRLLTLEGFVTDVSSRRRSSLRLRRTTEMLRTLVEQNLFGVYVIQEGAFQLANQAFARIFGYSRSEIRGMTPLKLVTDEDRERVAENLRRRSEGEVDAIHYSFRGLRKDGDTVHVEVHGARGHLRGKPALTGVLLDVTEREALQAQLRRTQKREALAELTGAVAHDFNNFLTGIMGALDLALMDLEGEGKDEDRARENLELARSVARRGASLTRQLLRFSRKSLDRPRSFDLVDLVEGMRPLLEQFVGSSITLSVHHSDERLPLHLDPGHMEQVIMNLVLNARDAMPDGGLVEIRTRRGEPVGDGAVLEVRDTGQGMDEETRKEVFSPFFTTKESGTGLGLATVRRIVEDAGGRVEVESERGRGALFRVALPGPADSSGSSEQAEAVRATRPAERIRPRAGRARILVVEDDEAIRELVEKALVRHGFQVDALRTAEAALSLLDAPDHPPDLLLSDVSLPDRSGTEIAARFLNDFPGRGVILASGYAPEEWPEGQELERRCLFLEKPFSIDELLDAVRRGLAGEPGDYGGSKAVGEG